MAGVQVGRLRVKVKPSSNKTEILGWKGDVLCVAVAAPADKNKANVELVRFLSKKFGPVRIVSGLSSRVKLLEFRDAP